MNRPPEGEAWIWLTREMIESPAWRLLSAPALRLVVRLMIEHMNHGGTENGRLICTYDQFEEWGISRKAISPALALAVELGFVDIVERGRRGYGIARQPSVYALTWLQRVDGSPPTNRWKTISPVPKGELVSVPKGELRRCPKGNQSARILKQNSSAPEGTTLNISMGVSASRRRRLRVMQ